MFGKVQGILTACLFTFMGVYDTMMTGIYATYELMIVILVAITVAIIILLAIILSNFAFLKSDGFVGGSRANP